VATSGEQAMGGTRRMKKNKRRRSRSSDKRGDGGWGSHRRKSQGYNQSLKMTRA
jgi:hypothetical protein